MKTLRLFGFALLFVIGIIGLSNRVLAQASLINPRVFRTSRPAPYAHASYFSQAFIDEMFSTERAWRLTSAGYWTLDDFAGQWINFRNGMRVTTSQPGNAERILYMLGNSTLLDLEVPDDLTISSQLQVFVGSRFKVMNLGSTAPTIQSQFFKLRALPIKPGDIVLFYDGVTDATTIYTSAANQIEVNTFCRFARDALGSLALIRWACPLPYETIPPSINNIDALQSSTRTQVNYFESILRETAQYVQSKGARFVHILQPQMWSKPLSEYELNLESTQIYPGMRKVFDVAWPALQKAARESGVENYDLTHAYDALRAGGVEIYLDYCHVNDAANAVMAKAMYDVLFPYL